MLERAVVLVLPVLLFVACCSDPFGVERERLIVEITLYEQECGNLESLAEEVQVLRQASADLTTRWQSELERLRTAEECGPCADHLEGLYSGLYKDDPGALVGEPPRSSTTASKGEPLADLESLQGEWIARRDDLRDIAENKESYERELMHMLEMETSWEEPVCEPEACQQVREACREGC